MFAVLFRAERRRVGGAPRSRLQMSTAGVNGASPVIQLNGCQRWFVDRLLLGGHRQRECVGGGGGGGGGYDWKMNE